MLLVFHFFNKKMAQRMGGGDGSMMFGMGKSNAKVYVKSTTGIKFKDVAGEEGKGTAGGDRGLSPQAGALQRDRRIYAQGRTAGRTSRNR